MKAVLLVGVLVVVCIVLFVVGVLRPGRSRRMQDRVDRASMKAERNSDRRAGRFGDVAESSLRVARKTADNSAEAGREARHKLRS
ncbi:MAG: hypothetical protein M3N24_06560 [Actinomycetota bacterium]|nr:hypothetical protein [Actinomycetota bacterium]